MQIKIGPKFFRKELRVYRDVPLAFWRELIQNSYGADSTRIDITIGDETNGITPVSFADNGTGMTRETLENVYFQLGETTKSGDSVGGFGKARILTCFAQDHYNLRTGKLFVNGQGADYTIEDTETHQIGVILEIGVITNGSNFKEALTSYLSKSHLQGCGVYINGERHTEWTFKNKFERRLSFANIYTNKSKHAGVLVRVDGMLMFAPHLSASFLVIIEIDQDKSRDVLQSSRDGLVYKCQNELESFISELNINKQSALRQKRSKSTTYEGTGTFTAKRSKKMTDEQLIDEFDSLLLSNDCEALNESSREAIIKSGNVAKAIEHCKQRMSLKAPEPSPIPQGRMHSSGYQVDEDRVTLDIELFNVIIEDETTNQDVRNVINSYMPSNWDLCAKIGTRYDKRYGEVRSFRAGVEKYKILILWKAACESCIRLLQDELQIGGDTLSWGVGWCFTDPKPGDNADAMYKYADGVNWLMLNPVKPNGNMRLSVSKKRDMIKIISCAAHEVCHIIVNEHDERFANLLNNLLEECMFYQSDILNFMKASKEAAVARLDRLSVA